MKIKVNGEEKTFEQKEISVSDLLELCKVENPELVSVQLNGSFVEKKDYAGTVVSDNEAVDFLYFMGGGS